MDEDLLRKVVVNSNRFCQEGTWNVTLTELLGHMMTEIENDYGKRDQNFTILGVEFSKYGPRTCRGKMCRSHLIIQLFSESQSYGQLVFQLAHESIHTLAPVERAEVSVLEEGLASFFSKDYTCKHSQGCDWQDNAKYSEASELVAQLLAVDSSAIKKLRESQPIISHITSDLILEHYPSIGKANAERLGQKFY